MIRRGISLIVLIITIIVVIILAAVVILTLSKNNPIESAKEARFKEDVRTFQDELALTVSKQYTTAGGHRDEKITTSDFNVIKEYIPSFSEKYKDKFVIKDDELRYTKQLDDKEKEYAKSLNINIRKSILPDEYQEVEYIESTGTQWIELDYTYKNTTEIIMKIDLLDPTIKQRYFGGLTLHNGVAFGSDSNTFMGTTTGNWQYSFSKVLSVEYIIKCNAEGEWFFNDNYVTNTGKAISTLVKFSIFAVNYAPNDNSASTIYTPSLMKFKYAKLQDRDIKIELYPCYRKSDNEAGLYDLVEGKFYTNKGDKTKGDFVCGPEV